MSGLRSSECGCTESDEEIDEATRTAVNAIMSLMPQMSQSLNLCNRSVVISLVIAASFIAMQTVPAARLEACLDEALQIAASQRRAPEGVPIN